jgi:hypothetical protein
MNTLISLNNKLIFQKKINKMTKRNLFVNIVLIFQSLLLFTNSTLTTYRSDVISASKLNALCNIDNSANNLLALAGSDSKVYIYNSNTNTVIRTINTGSVND